MKNKTKVEVFLNPLAGGHDCSSATIYFDVVPRAGEQIMLEIPGNITKLMSKKTRAIDWEDGEPVWFVVTGLNHRVRELGSAAETTVEATIRDDYPHELFVQVCWLWDNMNSLRKK